MNVEVENVEDKIRRALDNSSLEDVAIASPVTPKKENKQNISYTKIFKILTLASVISILYLGRYDKLFNMQLTGIVVKTEKVFSTELSLLRNIFAINCRLNTEQFVIAIKSDDIVLANLLLEWGLDPNSKDIAGDTLLIVSVRQDKSQFVKELLSKGANANLQNARGEYALDFANPAIIEILVKAGADINVRDLSQRTYLIKSAIKNDFEQIKILAKAGADPNLQDSLGKTALHYASENKNIAIMDYLKSIGSEQNIVDKLGQKAIIEESKVEPVVEEQYNIKPSSKLTAVRVVGKVMGVWESESDIILTEIRAEVRNVGDYLAKNVIIKVKIPGANEVTLQGPSDLPAYTTIVYKATPNQAVTRAGDLKATATCENCHR